MPHIAINIPTKTSTSLTFMFKKINEPEYLNNAFQLRGNNLGLLFALIRYDKLYSFVNSFVLLWNLGINT